MKEFSNRVAVVTGAGSGIGRALAERCAHEGMKVVLADIDEEALMKTTRALQATGATVLAVRTDVSRREDVQALADRALEAFGAVHLLFNNAGVCVGWTVWETTLKNWEWVLGVNLWGVIYGVQIFAPIMLAQHSEGHIVNTASLAGLFAYMPSAPYLVSKHAIVALTEHLYHSLVLAHAHIGASVLCPGFVRTDIMNPEQYRPLIYREEPGTASFGPEYEAAYAGLSHAVDEGMLPEQVADCVMRGIREERLYILPDDQLIALVQKRTEDILRSFNWASDAPDQ